MDVLIIILLIAAAIILFLVELFIIPGISIAGIMAMGCIIYANYHAFTTMGTVAGIITLIVSAIAGIFSIRLFMRSKTLDRVALKQNITSTVGRNRETKVQVGDKGHSVTRLALIGYAEINGEIIEVKSADGFIPENSTIQVSRIMDGIVSVTEI